MPSKPKGLPVPGTPVGLPTIESASPILEEDHLDANIDKGRFCPDCGKEGRVVSNRLGVNVHCGPCKRQWPITNAPLRGETPAAIPRGISKTTRVEPDWGMAFEDDYEDG